MTWLTNRHCSVLRHCWLGHLTRKFVPKMTDNVLSGTINVITRTCCIVAVTESVRYDDGHCADTVATCHSHGTNRSREIVKWCRGRSRLWNAYQCTFAHVPDAYCRNNYSTTLIIFHYLMYSSNLIRSILFHALFYYVWLIIIIIIRQLVGAVTCS